MAASTLGIIVQAISGNLNKISLANRLSPNPAILIGEQFALLQSSLHGEYLSAGPTKAKR